MTPRTFVLFWSALGCNPDAALTRFNNDPVATIVSHADGDSEREGYPVSFIGNVSDANSPASQLTATWLSGGDTLCAEAPVDESGGSTCAAVLGLDDTEITFQGRDPANAIALVRVTLEVLPTEAPLASITTPDGVGPYYTNVPVAVAGAASDAEETPTTLTVAWTDETGAALPGSSTANADGSLAEAFAFASGAHTLNLTVTDVTGKTGSDSVEFTVGGENGPPTCAITSPTDGAAGAVGDTFALEGTVTDGEVGADRLTAEWTSDLDGVLGAAPPEADGKTALDGVPLSYGTHQVTLTGTDEVGATCATSVLFSVGDPPEVEISAPADGDVVNDGEPVTFYGTVSDELTAPEALTVVWESDVDGVLDLAPADATGLTTFSAAELSIGAHVITLTVTDEDGLYAQGTVALRVNALPSAPSIVITPTSPGTDDALVAAVTGGGVDPEGDPVSYAWSWSVDGVATGYTTDTVPASATTAGQTWAVVVTPNDGWSDGASGSASVGVGNSVPVLTSVSLTPDPAYEGDILACAPGSTTDADGDPITYVYAWTVGAASMAETGATLDDSWWDRGDEVTCTVTPADGTTAGAPVTSNRVTIANTPPEQDGVVISPTPAYADDTLLCEAVGFYDADGDSDAGTVEWSIGGVVVGTGDTLSGVFAGGDEVTCTATPNDGTEDGVAVSDTIVITNTPPVLTSVTLTPASPGVNDTLTCTPGATTDADGTTAFTYAYAWTVDGVAVAGTSATLAGAFQRSDRVACSVTPSDGDDAGASVGSTAVTVEDTAPVATVVALTPTSPRTNDTLTASASGTDADGDAVQFGYAWTVNGVAVAPTSATLTGAYFDRGDVVSVAATPSDGTLAGTAMSATSVTVANTAPSLTGAVIAPTTVTAASVLTCSASGYSDADGDADASTFAWYVGAVYVSAGPTLSSGFRYGDVVACVVAPSDGTDSGTAVSTSVTVANTAPVLASVSLSPATAYEASTLTCAPGVTTDADGTTSFTYTYAWSVNGATVSPVSSTLTGAWFARGDYVSCQVTPSDGTTAGSPVDSASVTISNTAPIATSVSLAPTTLYTDDTLTATAAGTDADGDGVLWSYIWYVNGSAAGGTGSTLSGTYFSRGDSVAVRATPTDGTASGSAVVSTSVTVLNSPPSITAVSITPDPADATDTLSCGVLGFTDADGDTNASTYAWTIDGVAAGTGATLSSGFVGDSEVTCTVTPYDGSATGTAVSDSITIGASAPVLASVSLTPTTAYEASTLTCTPGTTTDADGTTSFTYRYAWYVDGVVVAPSSSTLSGTYFARGQAVYCRVTPNDGAHDGTAVASNVVTIGNTAPVVSAVTLSPATAYTSDTLTASVTAADADGDAVAYTYAWYVNGAAVGATGSSLAGTSYFSRGDDVYVTVTPTDGTTAGAAVSSAARTISNTAPTISSATVSPDPAYATSTLTCVAGGYADADGDTNATTYAWTINGAAAGTGATLSSGFVGGNVVACTATANDGTSSGTTASDSVTVSNSAPVLASVSISPSTADESSTLTCTPGSVSDPDGTTAITYTTTWHVNSALVAPTTATLTGTYFSRGDAVYCSATPSDGTDTGATVSSSPITIGNSAPTVTAVTLTPTTAYEGSTLTCAATTADADGDSVSTTYAWYVGGASVGASTSTLTGTSFNKGDSVYCRVTPSDGTVSGTAVASSAVTIGNSAPSAPTVIIDPTDPEAGLDAITCSIDAAASDADSDALTYTFTWTRNGAAYTGATSTSTTSTVPATATTDGDVFICSATASDGSASSSAATDSVTVLSTSYYVGYSTEYGTAATLSVLYMYAEAITVSSACTLEQIGVIDKVAGGVNVQLALYTNSASRPGTLVASTGTSSAVAGRVELDVTGGPVTLAAGTYWVAVQYQNVGKPAAVASSTNVIAYRPSTWGSSFPSSYGTTGTVTTHLLNLYIVVR